MTREESEMLSPDEPYTLEPDMVDRHGRRYANYEEYEAEAATRGDAVNTDFGEIQPFAALPALDRHTKAGRTARSARGSGHV